MDHSKLWTLIRADLARARSTVPGVAASHSTIDQYQDFLDHNEFELACDMLEAYAEDHCVSRDFWLALRDAATKMHLSDRASRYEDYSTNP
jgi:hypothetical protein